MKHNLKGFSLFELLLVLSLIGIFSSIALISYPKSHLQEAQEQVINHLHFTRYLALHTTKTITQAPFCQSDFCQEERKHFEKSFWRLQFTNLKNIGWAYSIFSDSARISKTKNFDNRPMDSSEIARNPFDGKYLSVYTYNNTKFANGLREGDLSLQKRYKISHIKIKGGCGEYEGGRILFDELGFLRCKIANNPVSLPTNTLIIELLDDFGRSAKICILQSGFVKKC
ncbi:prepilin-type N-terminal cleavage/methylation domain-containing protein [Helicobacter mesocricetorum]|uniref:prepilin-type N-terminal cleavage/methylation domain-containing protein n=1 Tax=Helicobacter mesocricetorum TaxID=87012 RepID=UPI000CF1A553|nr:prepilin-type N-terminal cleavage/methylation domain-containing protein [Helicobacter mesocricetorum]